MGLKDLFKPKWQHSDSNVRRAAVEKIIDQALLSDIAKNDENGSVRQAAVRKLSNQTVLAEIAKNDKESDVRLAAVRKLSNQTVLAEIAKNDKESDVRLAAIRKVTDQALLAEIAKNDENDSVRQAAVENQYLIDQTVLAEITKNAKDMHVCKAAVEKLTDKDILTDLAKQGYNAVKKRIYELSPEAEVERERTRKAIAIHEGESLYIFALIKEIGGRGESFAQQICDCAYGRGLCRAGMWKFAGVNEISVNHALRLKNQLGIRWGEPENTWEGILPSGEKVAALFWKT